MCFPFIQLPPLSSTDLFRITVIGLKVLRGYTQCKLAGLHGSDDRDLVSGSCDAPCEHLNGEAGPAQLTQGRRADGKSLKEAGWHFGASEVIVIALRGSLMLLFKTCLDDLGWEYQRHME